MTKTNSFAGSVPAFEQYQTRCASRAASDLGLAYGALCYRIGGEGSEWTRENVSREDRNRLIEAKEKLNAACKLACEARAILADIDLCFGR